LDSVRWQADHLSRVAFLGLIRQEDQSEALTVSLVLQFASIIGKLVGLLDGAPQRGLDTEEDRRRLNDDIDPAAVVGLNFAGYLDDITHPHSRQVQAAQ